MMQTELVEAAYDDLLRLNLKPTVRRVRERIGHGSLSDINRLVASIREQRAIEDAASVAMPPALKERCDRLLLQVWQVASTEATERAAEVERTSEEKVRAIQEEMATMLTEGDAAIAESEQLKAELDVLRSEAEEARDRARELETKVLVLTQRSEDATTRANGLQQALNLLMTQRDRSLPERKNLVPTEENVAEAIFEVLKSASFFDITADFDKLGWFGERHFKKFQELVDRLVDKGVLQSAGPMRVAVPGH